jgi:sigma-B regulation protein RsbU (phosphoserine phosphatase)
MALKPAARSAFALEPGVGAHGLSHELSDATRYRLLLEIAHRIRGTLDLDKILNHLLDSLAEHLDFDAAGIFVLREALGRSRVASLGELIAGVTWRGFSERSPRSDPMLREGKGIVGQVIRSGQPIVAPDVRLDPYYIDGRPGTLSEIAVPIVRDGLVIGALNLESDRLAAFDDHSLEVLRFYADATAIAVEKAILHEQLLEARRMEEQLRIAQEVQARLLPTAFPRIPGYDLAALCLPCSRVGGDYFDFIPRPDGSLGLAVADVAGHGIPAALLMSALRALMRTHVQFGASLVQLARTLNRQVPESMAGAAFVTAFLGTLSPAEGLFSYVNCGHVPPLLLRAGGAVETLESGGPLLGVMEDARFGAGGVQFERGDALLLLTDGVVELTDGAGRWFGAERLAALASNVRALPAEDMIRQIMRATREFSGAVEFEDDVTLMIVKRDP